MYQLNDRAANVIGFFVCHELLLVGYYYQFVEGLDPCPLCIFQRVAFMLLALAFLAGAVYDGSKTYKQAVNGFGIFGGLMGIFLAGRHLYLQGLPADEVPACGPGLDYMMQLFSYIEVLQKVLSGSGECAEVSWTFLGLSMPGWAMVWFILFTAIFGWRVFTLSSTNKPL